MIPGIIPKRRNTRLSLRINQRSERTTFLQACCKSNEPVCLYGQLFNANAPLCIIRFEISSSAHASRELERLMSDRNHRDSQSKRPKTLQIWCVVALLPFIAIGAPTAATESTTNRWNFPEFVSESQRQIFENWVPYQMALYRLLS